MKRSGGKRKVAMDLPDIGRIEAILRFSVWVEPGWEASIMQHSISCLE